MPTKKNTNVTPVADANELKETKLPKNEAVDKEIESFDDYATIEECQEELDAMDIWYRDRKKALNDRIRKLKEEENNKEMIKTVKQFRDNLVATGVDPTEVDSFIMDALRNTMGIKTPERVTGRSINESQIEKLATLFGDGCHVSRD